MSQRYSLSLGGAALASVAVAWLVQRALRTRGAYQVTPLTSNSVSATSLHIQAKATLVNQSELHSYLDRIPGVLSADIQAVLLLFGADFLGQPTEISTGIALIHLVGVALAAYGVWFGLRRLLRSPDLVSLTLAIAVLMNAASYVLRTHNADVFGARDIAAVLPFSAALAGSAAKPQAQQRSGATNRSGTTRLLYGRARVCGNPAAGTRRRPTPSRLAGGQTSAVRSGRVLASRREPPWPAADTSRSAQSVASVTAFGAEQWNSKTTWYDPRLRQGKLSHRGWTC